MSTPQRRPTDPYPLAGPAAKDEGLALTEVRHLVEANASYMVLAIVLSRRLGRMATVEHRSEDGGLPTLAWASEDVGERRSDE